MSGKRNHGLNRLIPGTSKSEDRRIQQLGDARRAALTVLSTAGITTKEEQEILRGIIDKIQAQAEAIAGEAATRLMNDEPIK